MPSLKRFRAESRTRSTPPTIDDPLPVGRVDDWDGEVACDCGGTLSGGGSGPWRFHCFHCRHTIVLRFEPGPAPVERFDVIPYEPYDSSHLVALRRHHDEMIRAILPVSRGEE